MTIKVTGPNGEIVNFPDGTDRTTIDGVMRQYFGATPDDNYPQQTMSGFNEGLGRTLGAPVDVVNAGLRGWSWGVNKIAGRPIVSESERPLGVFDTQWWNDMQRRSGTVGPPSKDPGKQAARYVGGQVGMTAIPAIASGGLLPAAITLGSGFTSAAGGMIGNKVGGETGRAIGEVVGGAVPFAPWALRPPPRRALPTTEELNRAGGAGFDATRAYKVDYDAGAVSSAVSKVRMALEERGIYPERAPETYRLINALEHPPPNAIAELKRLMSVRESAGIIAAEIKNATADTVAANALKKALDGFITNPPPGAVLAGPARTAAETLFDANANYAAGKRSETLTGLERPSGISTQGVEGAAVLRAAAANSGKNLDNAIRSRVAAILLDPDKLLGFSQEEIALLNRVVMGTASRNTIRNVGKLLGGGGGLGRALTGGLGAAAGASAGGPVGAGIGAIGGPAIGAGATSIANSMTRRALNLADEAVRARSPLAARMPLPPDFTREALMRAARWRMATQVPGLLNER